MTVAAQISLCSVLALPILHNMALSAMDTDLLALHTGFDQKGMDILLMNRNVIRKGSIEDDSVEKG